jgi:carbon-monoxide dehydrogenase small subunit
MKVSFILDFAPVSVEAEPETRLIDLLRERFGLMSVKPGCGVGRCGACSVLSDGVAVNACLVMAWQLEGRQILTSAGLDQVEVARVVRGALVAENAFQCGYCAPGFVAVLTALLTATPDIDEAGLREGLAGNLCRCTGYHSILRAAVRAAAELEEARRAGASA